MRKRLYSALFATLLSPAALADNTLPMSSQLVDITPPVIEHDPMSESAPAGKPTLVTATVSDSESGVKTVNLFFRTKSTEPGKFNRIAMESRDGTTTYIAEIPERYVQGPGVEYYIEAVDIAGNKILRGVNFSPLLISVAPGPGGETTASGAAPTPGEALSAAEQDSQQKKNWLYVAGGVVAAGVIYALSDPGGGGGGGDKNKGSVTITNLPAP